MKSLASENSVADIANAIPVAKSVVDWGKVSDVKELCAIMAALGVRVEIESSVVVAHRLNHLMK